MLFDDYKNHKGLFIRKHLLWDFDVSNIDYEKMKSIIVQRVIERGNFNDWYAILNIYSLKDIVDTIKNISYLNKRDINFVHRIFGIPLNQLKCYTSQQLKSLHGSF